MSKLTEDERATLLGHIGAWKWERQGLEAAEADFFATVEAILTARLARVEALRDEWRMLPVWGPDEHGLHILDGVDVEGLLAEFDAALAAAPSREGES